MSSPPPSCSSRWQRAIGVVIGTAVGGIIYGIFLQALLVQSLIIDRKPLDPAEWREKLSGRAWICGLLSFLTMILVPLRFLTKGSESVINVQDEAGVAWFLVSLIFLVQLATVVYAYMRPELTKVEHPADVFHYFPLPNWFQRRLFISRSAEVLTSGAEAQRRTLLSVSYSLTLWKNWVQLLIIIMEFVQLMSLALDGGGALRAAGVTFLSPAMFEFMTMLKTYAWQFGITGDAESPTSYAVGFGILSGFGGFYIFLCGVFIALDLTVDSPLSPLLFVLLAGGFYGTVTSGLQMLMFYSSSIPHVIVGSLMLAYYSSTAVFVSIYRSDVKKSAKGEIRIIPTFTAVERLSKGILAAIFVSLVSASPALRSSVVFGFTLLFAVYMLWIRPYSVYAVTSLRAACVSVACWTSLITFLAAVEAVNGGTLSGLLVGGWVMIPIGFCISNNLRCCADAISTAVGTPRGSERVLDIANPLTVRVDNVQPAATPA
jgi:hypothetical protein